MSQKYLILVLTEPTEGKDAEFNDYYENIHLDEVIDSAGYETAQRFKLALEVGEGAPLPYLAMYEATGKSAEDVIQRLNESRHQRQQSDALNKKTARIWVFEPTGKMHQA